MSTARTVDQIWFTRCPVPTATGLAYKLGWLSEEFAPDGIRIDTLQETDTAGEFSRHHYDHQLPTLFREGGNLLAIAARAQGAPSRLIGLTWIDEAQSIIVRPDSGISRPAQLEGKRLALPAFSDQPIVESTRGRSTGRGMSLHGYKNVLATAGLTLDDVTLVEVGVGAPRAPREPKRGGTGPRTSSTSVSLAALARGEVDAAYVKGAASQEEARRLGLVVGIDLDVFPDRASRVNNGTPRPITVHEDLLKDHFELVVRFLYQSLRAAEWAKTHLTELQQLLQYETRAGIEGVGAAYRNGFHRSLAPDLSDERVELFRRQKNFMFTYGLLDRDFDFDGWIDHRPIEEARRRLDSARAAA